MSKSFREELIDIVRDLPGNRVIGSKTVRGKAKDVRQALEKLTDFGQEFVDDQLGEVRSALQRQAGKSARKKENRLKMIEKAKEETGPIIESAVRVIRTACPFCTKLLTPETTAKRKVGVSPFLVTDDVNDEVHACLDVPACLERAKEVPRGSEAGW